MERKTDRKARGIQLIPNQRGAGIQAAEERCDTLMSTASTAVPQRLVLDNVDWRTYSRFLRLFAERPAVRLTYDRGTLEIMSPLLEHAGDADFLGGLVVALTEELKRPLKRAGSTTLRRRRLRRGLEPDRSYWIANEPAMRGKRHYDSRVDPPPR